jgi:hypothetical protein
MDAVSIPGDGPKSGRLLAIYRYGSIGSGISRRAACPHARYDDSIPTSLRLEFLLIVTSYGKLKTEDVGRRTEHSSITGFEVKVAVQVRPHITVFLDREQRTQYTVHSTQYKSVLYHEYRSFA